MNLPKPTFWTFRVTGASLPASVSIDLQTSGTEPSCQWTREYHAPEDDAVLLVTLIGSGVEAGKIDLQLVYQNEGFTIFWGTGSILIDYLAGANKIDAWDGTFTPVDTTGMFSDPKKSDIGG